MKKLIVLAALMALAGCNDPGYEIICSTKGEIFRQYQGDMSSTAESLHNRRQVCQNQPDGSIVIKSTLGLGDD